MKKTLLLSLLFLTSCGPTTVSTKLGYVPDFVRSQTKEKSAVHITFEDITDDRPYPNYIGSWKHFHFISDEKTNFAQWVSDWFKLQLANSGYFVENPGQKSAYVLKGRLVTTSENKKKHHRDPIAFEFTLLKNGSEVFTKTYFAKSNNLINANTHLALIYSLLQEDLSLRVSRPFTLKSAKQEAINLIKSTNSQTSIVQRFSY